MCDRINAAGEYIRETNELMHRKRAPFPFTTLSDLSDTSFPAIYTFSYLIPYITIALVAMVVSFCRFRIKLVRFSFLIEAMLLYI